MSKISHLSREHAALAIIDMQEAFRPVIPDFGEVAGRIAKAVQGARLLEVPVIVTEQYPRGLKHTAEEILPHLSAEAKAGPTRLVRWLPAEVNCDALPRLWADLGQGRPADPA